MITTRIIGGLGNQLFQYAVGRHLALIHNTKLKLDLNAYKTYELHDYVLDKFNINAKPLTKDDHDQKALIIKKELCLSFDETVLDLPNNLYLMGYWTTEKYFKAIKDVLLDDIRLKNMSFECHDLITRPIRFGAVSVHARRGDKANDRLTNSIYGTCPPSYYRRAMELIEKKIDSPLYLVFSDDMNWCKHNLNFKDKNVKFMDQGLPCWEDLMLLKNCEHHIISNSSFSWWGAWLSEAPTKIIIAPNVWSTKQVDNKDIIPSNWTQIERNG